MNRGIFALTINERSGLIAVAPESARTGRSRRATPASGTRRKLPALLLAALTASPLGFAAQPPGMQAHPTLQWQNAQIDAQRTNSTTLTIQQTQPKAILNWQKFNLGAGEAVQFDQKSSSWTALNRIFDQNPSVIQGRISAPGQVYLINQNGIIFDRGAQINVHSLIASSLDIPNAIYEQGINATRFDNTFSPVFSGATGFIQVNAGAVIQTADGGKVLLFAPTVENRGRIETPQGQTVLAAGKAVYIAAADNDPNLRGLVVEVDSGGSVKNVGDIIAQRGSVSMVGMAVNQSGVVKTTTTVNLNGSVYLLARDTVSADLSKVARRPVATNGGTLELGKDSRTIVAAETSDPNTISDQQQFYPSKVVLAGRNVHLQAGSAVIAAGGDVTIAAAADPSLNAPAINVNDSRVYFEPGSIIDVSGTGSGSTSSGRAGEVATTIAMERNVVEAELRGSELRDAPLLRNSFLRGEKVKVDIRESIDGAVGTSLADVSGYTSQIKRQVGEKTAAGGKITVTSEGDIVFPVGATLDASGGAIRYADGFIDTTKLLTADGKVVDISAARADQVYIAFADRWTVDHRKWNVTQTWSSPQLHATFEAGYIEGSSAGAITLAAPAMLLQGELRSRTVAGPLQRTAATLPQGLVLQIGGIVNAAQKPPDFTLRSDVVWADAMSPVAWQGSFDSPLSDDLKQTLTLGPNLWEQPALRSLAVYSNRGIEVGAGRAVEMAPGAVLSLVGENVEVARSFRIPGGQIQLSAQTSIDYIQGRPANVSLGADVVLDTSGLWVNDRLALRGIGDPLAPVFQDGGKIALTAFGSVDVAGSVLDASGGARLQSNGTLVAGKAGAISLQAGVGTNAIDAHAEALNLTGSTLRGFALAGGGSLSLASGSVWIGSASPRTPGELLLPPEFFRDGGFTQYSVTGRDGVTLAQNVSVDLVGTNFQLKDGVAIARTGTVLSTLVSYPTLDPAAAGPVRSPVSLELVSTNPLSGDVRILSGADIAADPGATISLQSQHSILVDGRITAPGGQIKLALAKIANDEQPGGSYRPEQSIWLGRESVLSVAGAANTYVDSRGLRRGEVLAGGSISLDAKTGFVAIHETALLDVSGAAATLDLPIQVGNLVGVQSKLVGSAAGSISVSAREGAFLDGRMVADAGAAGLSNGSFSLTMERTELRDDELVQPPRTTTYLVGPRELVLRQSGSSLPGDLSFGAALPSSENGKGYISTAALERAGFDRITLKSRNQIHVTEPANLSAGREITLDAPLLRLDSGVTASFRAPYVALGNSDRRYQGSDFVGAPTVGTATLNVAADLIDIVGAFATGEVKTIALQSTGDVRVRGVAVDPTVVPVGALHTQGDLTIAAAQLYPTSFSQFTIGLDGDGGKFTLRKGRSDPAPLSAGGSIRISATAIEQGGVIRAPLGTIDLHASDSLVLEAGSTTSVSAHDFNIPLGLVQNGTAWVYDLGLGTGQQVAVKQAPEKAISLFGASVQVDEGARVDLSGGGDIYAYEFTPGPGGSADVLSKPGVYAVIPGFGSGYAPYDFQYSAGTDLHPGDAVYLSGGSGLPAGVYTLLPAHYALLDGAYMVTAKAGTQDLLPMQSYRLLDGSSVTAGYRMGADGRRAVDRWSGFQVTPGAVARSQSQFTDSFGDAFFAGGAATLRLPMDAGRLAMIASSKLDLNGSLTMDPAGAGRRGAIDIAADKILLSDSVAPAAGTVTVSPAALAAANPESILIGGLRTNASDSSVRIDVTTSTLEVAMSGEAPLIVPELLLVASDNLSVRSGSKLAGASKPEGPVAPKVLPATYRIGDADTPGSGDGAFVRLSNGAQATLSRSGVARQAGVLDLASNAQVIAAGSALLDATLSTSVNGAIGVAARGELRLGADRIVVGKTAAAGTLLLTSALLSTWQDLRELAFTSYSSLEFQIAGTLGSAELDSLVVNTGSVLGSFDGSGSAKLLGKRVELTNTVAAASPASTSHAAGTLEVGGDEIVIGPGSVAVQGFASQTLTATKRILGQGAGGLAASGDITLQSGLVTVASGASQRISSSGKLSILGLGETPLLGTSPIGGALTLEAQSVSHAGIIEMPAGQLTINALATGDSLTLNAGARIVSTGVAKHFGERVVTAPAGSVTLSTAGNLTIAEGAQIDVTGVDGSDAGSIALMAPNGSLGVAGQLKGWALPGAGSNTPQQGSISVDAHTLADFGALARKLQLISAAGAPQQGGFQEALSIRARSGDLTVAGDATIKAHRVELEADDGDITIQGKIDASGTKGGAIRLSAAQANSGPDNAKSGKGNVRLAAGAVLSANATQPASLSAGSVGDGGSVLLATATADGAAPAAPTNGSSIDVASGATIDVRAAGAGEGGTVTLRAPRTGAGTDVAIARFDGNVHGASSVVAEAVRVYGDTPEGTVEVGVTAGPGKIAVSQLDSDSRTFSQNAGAIAKRLGQDQNGLFHVRPGVELRSAGDLIVSVNETVDAKEERGWDLSTLRYGGEPGSLTLRAGGNLILNGSISDGFTKVAGKAMPEWTLASGDSWSYRLVGGADLNAADPLQVVRAPATGTGDVRVSFGRVGTDADPVLSVIRTGKGSIEVAAARNVSIGAAGDGRNLPATAIYTAGVPDTKDYSSLGAFTAPATALIPNFPTGGGDISISAGGDIVGAASTQLAADWLFRQGFLKADGTFNRNTAWWPRFDRFKQNIGTFGGGDITLVAGGSLRDVSAVVATSGRYFGTVPVAANAVVNGGGDLAVSAGGDILGGFFLIAKGDARLQAGGSIRAGSIPATAGNIRPILSLGDGSIRAYARGDLEIETVFSPTVAAQAPANAANASSASRSYFFTYGAQSSVDLTSAVGNITVGNNRTDLRALATGLSFISSQEEEVALVVYPPITRMAALSGDIAIDNSFAVYPAARGTFELLAGNSVTVKGLINVSDLDPRATLPAAAPSKLFDTPVSSRLLTDFTTVYGGQIYHAATPVHTDDDQPALIYAERGDIVGTVDMPLALLPKRAIVSAGRDIRNATLIVQHNNPNDVTEVAAGRDLTFDVARPDNVLAVNPSRIAVDGPGTLEVRAGRNIDLGNSFGIVGRGNLDNPALATGGVDIALTAGTTAPDYAGFAARYLGDSQHSGPYLQLLTQYLRGATGDDSVGEAGAWEAFQQLPLALQRPFLRNVFYSELRQAARDFVTTGNAAYDQGYAAIKALFPAAAYNGGINLVFSQIKTEQGGVAYRPGADRFFHAGGNIDFLVPGGGLVAGLAQVPADLIESKRLSVAFDDSPSRLGIVAVGTGGIRSMTRGDFLVNQSRVFTLGGGDVLLWTSEGNIDAGKGAKTASSAPPPLISTDSQGNTVVQIQGSVSGSGIGVLLVTEDTLPGDTFLVAPKGEVNAGDAGIRAAGNLVIAAVRVVGGENIQVGGAASGVALTSSGGISGSVGGVADAGAQATKNLSNAVGGDANAAAAAGKTFIPSFITVEVLGLGDDDDKTRKKDTSQ